MGEQGFIRSGHSCQQDARLAVQEFHAAVSQEDPSLVVFFCSSEYDLDALTDEMNRLFGNLPVVGCTTAGEIGPSGYCDRSLAGVSFHGGACTAVTGLLDDLQHFEITRGQAFAQSLVQRLGEHTSAVNSSNTFAFLLIDGLSVREEPVVRTLQTALRSIPLCGGSAGDDLKFSRTWVFHDGAFHPDSAVLILANTTFPFKVFKTQHFVSDVERLVVTEADGARRIVKEINGLPAAAEYARVIGVPERELNPMRFAASPVVVVLDGTDFVRSIQKVNPDGSLTFYCAIDEGVVLRVAHSEDLVANLERTFDALHAEIGRPQLVLGCDCILRNLELTQKNVKERVSEIFRYNRTVGFSTYGEQFGGVHVNQTFTGIAIGDSRERHDG